MPANKYCDNGSDHQHVSKGSMRDAHNTDDHKYRQAAERTIVSPNAIAIAKEKSRWRIAYFQKFGVMPTIAQLIEYANQLGCNTNGW